MCDDLGRDQGSISVLSSSSGVFGTRRMVGLDMAPDVFVELVDVITEECLQKVRSKSIRRKYSK